MYGGWFSYEKDMQTAKKSDAGKAIYSMSFEKLKMVNTYLRNPLARRGGAEVAGWTLDRKIQVRFCAYPHRVWAL